MTLKVVQPAHRKVARSRDQLGIIGEDRWQAWLIGRFAFEIAVVLELNRPAPLDRQAAPHPLLALEQQSLIAPRRAIRIAVERLVLLAVVESFVDDVDLA